MTLPTPPHRPTWPRLGVSDLPTLDRRSFLRSAATAAIGAAGIGGLAGCATRAATGGRPAPVANTAHTRLVFQPYYGSLGPQEAEPIMRQGLAPFLDKNPSLDIQFLFSYPASESSMASAVIAGTAPDVFEYWASANLMQGGYLLDLQPYVKQSNGDLSVFPAGQLHFFQRSGHLYALPITIEWIAVMVNQTLLDTLGLPYPSADWTAQDAADFWRRAARPSPDQKKRIWGGWFTQYASSVPENLYFRQWGGSVVDPADPTRSTIDSTQCTACLQYMADLVAAGVCDWGFGENQFWAGQSATALTSDWRLVPDILSLHDKGLKVDFLPLPAGPAGGVTFGSQAYYGIPSTTPDPNASWSLLDWISFQPDWARLMLRLYLLQPPTLAQGDEYLTTIGQVAPPLQGKNVQAFTHWQARAADDAFLYNNTQVYGAIGAELANVWSGKASPQEATRQAAQQADAIETAGAATANAAAVIGKQFPAQGAGIAAVPLGI